MRHRPADSLIRPVERDRLCLLCLTRREGTPKLRHLITLPLRPGWGEDLRGESLGHELAGRVAVVVGGSAGIGAAAARRLADAGAAVVVGGHEAGDVEAVVGRLRDDGAAVDGTVGDVRRDEDVARLVNLARDRFGGLDVLVYSAGIQRYGTVADTTPTGFDEVIGINLRGLYLAAHHAVPLMRERGGGAIVAVASVQAHATQKGVAAYAASKGGIVALARAMAVDHAPEGIRVNVVSPGSVDTPMLRRAAQQFANGRTDDDMVREWGLTHPLGRVARADEVAEVIAFLAGPRASFVTGAELRVDGGLLATLAVSLPE